MPVITRPLKVKLATDFFNTVTRVRAVGTYYDESPGGSSSSYVSASIDLQMLVAWTNDESEPIAKLNENAYFENPINLTVTPGDYLVISKLEFMNEGENAVFFEWNFTTTPGSEELKYTGNGELHIESFDFDIE